MPSRKSFQEPFASQKRSSSKKESSSKEILTHLSFNEATP
ncbi:hypothetical protein EVA_17014 [gut metagenome]|uniref:Uncharacterized protein n=1 Tax=gut metagenome TaxID=749906 RepID=J9C4Y4_9ZZZZ